MAFSGVVGNGTFNSPYCSDHGWQRSVCTTADDASRRRASGGSYRGTGSHRDMRWTGPGGPDALRIFCGKLEAASNGSRDVVAAAAAVSAAGVRKPDEE